MTSTNPQAATTEASSSTAAPAPPEKGWSPQLSRQRVLVASVLIVIGVLVALFSWGLPPFAGGDQTTNNAYVRGRTTIVSPQVAGYLVEVRVADFQKVEKGQLLARIDATPFREKVQQGAANIAAQKANLANSEQSLRSAQAQLQLQDAAVASAQAGYQKAQADMNRINELVDEGSVSLRERDQALAALRQSQAGVRQAQAQRAIAAENVRSVRVGRGALEAQVLGAEASRDLAAFELSRTEIRAPRSGRLSEITAREGQLVSAGTQLMYIVPDELWVVANFKEAQTEKMAVGQRATLEVDALGGAKLTGRVQSIAPAASSEFSIVKPDTGAGNFVKVPQRIAVRIVLDRGQKIARRLGPGMSVVATVHTGE
ncbi:MAG: secretion protein HlyD [Sphingomonadales bacterium RIFCSPHIGHO2_01_FULL_65_20]|uniref:HlyD family secretion protein n=1 Tax=unclassified Blastomonas TaxID=2626550 RepID=UPI00082B4439|nr:HlyD family secretion protein [Blastomonas sp.]MCH2237242.1 HlyD family secretion protein [Blastomonas sp.]OHC92656.1 MAG: secretion protein HlyD [Sphingomonadales bacterium RIFCSPHIGHO2_01_FULL_65_20]